MLKCQVHSRQNCKNICTKVINIMYKRIKSNFTPVVTNWWHKNLHYFFVMNIRSLKIKIIKTQFVIIVILTAYQASKYRIPVHINFMNFNSCLELIQDMWWIAHTEIFQSVQIILYIHKTRVSQGTRVMDRQMDTHTDGQADWQRGNSYVSACWCWQHKK